MATKSQIRQEVYARRRDAGEGSLVAGAALILERLYGLDWYRDSRRILAYVDFRREVPTRGLLERAFADGKEVAVPRVEHQRMSFFKIASLQDLQPGSFGIWEPIGDKEAFWPDALMVMPGVAFDRQRHRIGYGGGYYDRYLAELGGMKTVALAYAFQLFDSVPYEETDYMPDILLTEEGLYT